MDHISGEYHQVRYQNSKSRYWSFIPNDLRSITAQWKLDVELSHLLTSAHRELGILEGMIRSIPENEPFMKMIYLREAQKSCAIDHKIASLEGMLNSSFQTLEDRTAVNCYKSLNALAEMPFTLSTICDLQSIVVQNESNDSIGTMRKTAFLMHPQYTSNMAEYNPPPPELLNELMMDLESFARKKNTLDVLIRAAMIYYQFETIHPFEGGNGRIGRLLIPWFLMQNKMLSKPVLSLSGYLLEHNDECLYEFRGIQSFSTYTDWLTFFIQGVILSAQETIRQLESVKKIRNCNLQKIKALGKSADKLLRLYGYVEENPVLTINNVAETLNISYNTAAKNVEMLRELKILRQMNAQSRNRIYAYEEFLKCFK